MSRPLSKSAIVKAVAGAVAKRVTRRVVAVLQRITDARLSGDDSVLRNSWDEICAQVQDEESFAWDAYVQTMEGIVGAQLSILPDHERESLWLQTPQGEDWSWKEPPDRDDSPVEDGDTVRWIMKEHIIPTASEWSNPRIRAYVEQSSARD